MVQAIKRWGTDGKVQVPFTMRNSLFILLSSPWILLRHVWGRWCLVLAIARSFQATVHFQNLVPKKWEQTDEKNGKLCVREIVFLRVSYRKLLYYLPRFSLNRRTCLLYRGNQMLHFWGTKRTSRKKVLKSLDFLVPFLDFLAVSEIHKMIRFYTFVPLHVCILAEMIKGTKIWGKNEIHAMFHLIEIS